MFTLQAKNEEETMAIAAQLAQLLEPKDVILLEGDLGAGKTTFTKGLAKGLGIETVIKSPTYTLIREYTKGRLPLYHMDVYRLEDVGEPLLVGSGHRATESARALDETSSRNSEVATTSTLVPMS